MIKNQCLCFDQDFLPHRMVSKKVQNVRLNVINGLKIYVTTIKLVLIETKTRKLIARSSQNSGPKLRYFINSKSIMIVT